MINNSFTPSLLLPNPALLPSTTPQDVLRSTWAQVGRAVALYISILSRHNVCISCYQGVYALGDI
jgi:hypothetical protein